MSRPIVRLALFVLVFSALAGSAHAQQCSVPDQTVESTGASASCTTTSMLSPATVPFTQVQSGVNKCLDENNNGAVYASNPTSVTGSGQAHCTPQPLYCFVKFFANATQATTPSDYNRFYNQAYNGTYTSSGCKYPTTFSQQDFYQCLGRACTQSGGGGGGAGGGGTCSPDKKNCGNGASPVILDLNGQGFVLTSAANGVMFDISGTGNPVQIGWIAQGADNALLALPGSDGLVHNGQQLFGNFTPQPKSDHPNGFAALAVYDDPKNGGNGDGIIDSRDAIFSSLRLWIDANHDGISQPEELHTLPSLGINSISLKYREDDKTDQYGNQFRYRARLNPDKSTDAGKTAYDVFFVEEGTPTTKNIPKQLVPDTTYKCKVPVRQSALSSTGGL
jgi:hypothetical protein